MGWLTAVKELLGIGSTLLSGWAERKKIKVEAETAIARAESAARIDRAERGQVAEIDWNVKNTDNAKSSWKDEFWTIVLAIPLVMCFIPGLSMYVKQGFDAISDTPDWYQVAVALAIAASFGYRKFADWRMRTLTGGVEDAKGSEEEE